MNKELSTEEQRANLMTLAEFLDGLEAPQFNMGAFSESPNKQWAPNHYMPEQHTCGTVCCAVGWAPAALGLLEEDLVGMEWGDVAEKYLGLSYEDYEDYEVYEYLGLNAWDLLFNGQWKGYEPYPEQAADRIRKYLNEGQKGIKPTPWLEASHD